MALVVNDIVFDQGADYTRTITLSNDDDTPIDLTGYTISGSMKKTYCQSSADLVFTIVILDQVTNTGEFTFTIPATLSAALPCDHTSFVFDIKMTSAGGIKTRIVEGKAKMRLQVTP
jgi:hypothetical protein